MTVAAKRLPLRAYVELGRESELRKAWSEGKTFWPWEPRERAEDKPIEEMDLSDLVPASALKALGEGKMPDYGEPASESRRSFMERGVGVLSLNIRRLFGDEGESVELIELVADDPDRDDQHFRGTAYITPNPMMRERILREQMYAYSSGDVRLRILSDADGNITFETVGRGFRNREDFVKAARGILASYGNPTKMSDLQARVDAINASLDRDPTWMRAATPFAPEESYRLSAPAHAEWHGAFEQTSKGEIVATVMHGKTGLNLEDQKYGPWHGRAKDAVDLELGSHCIADDALEALLGVTEWTEDGDPYEA